MRPGKGVLKDIVDSEANYHHMYTHVGLDLSYELPYPVDSAIRGVVVDTLGVGASPYEWHVPGSMGSPWVYIMRGDD